MKSEEFYDPRLVAIYNTVCPLDGYEKFYLELAEKVKAKTIIDIGCGTGLLTNELGKKGYTMIGVEPSALMLEVARSSYGEKITWIEGDALALDNMHADLAIMTGHVAQFHLEDAYWEKALLSIYHALRPGGYLAFESRNPAVQVWNTNKKKDVSDWYTPGIRKKVVDSINGPLEVWSEIVNIQGENVTTDIHYLFADTGEELISHNTLRFRSREEITKALEKAGFHIENVYGNWDWSLATVDSPEFIFVAKRI